MFSVVVRETGGDALYEFAIDLTEDELVAIAQIGDSDEEIDRYGTILVELEQDLISRLEQAAKEWKDEAIRRYGKEEGE